MPSLGVEEVEYAKELFPRDGILLRHAHLGAWIYQRVIAKRMAFSPGMSTQLWTKISPQRYC
jgi:hypothetical protein